ncbi:hypothetical protein Tco_0670299 [Tanacetum coccineum]
MSLFRLSFESTFGGFPFQNEAPPLTPQFGLDGATFTLVLAVASDLVFLMRVRGLPPVESSKRPKASSLKKTRPPLCSSRFLEFHEMDLLSFIRTADPTKVRIGERQRAEDEPKLLDTTVGRVVPLLPIALARAESELDASVDKLFNESGSGNQAEQGDSASGGHGVGIQLVSEAAGTVVEDVTLIQPKRQKKRKTVIVDAGEPSHPAKTLRDDHEAPGGPAVGGKSRSMV